MPPTARFPLCRRLSTLALLGTVISSLSGCADCNFLASSNSTACNLELAALGLVVIPVMTPYDLIQDARDTHAAEQQEIKLREGVEKNNLSASEACLFSCRSAYRVLKDDRWRVERLAAQQVLQHFALLPALSPRQQAERFVAYNIMANSLAKTDPAAAKLQISALIDQGQSVEMWAYVQQDKDLPANSEFFKDIVQDVVCAQLLKQYHLSHPSMDLYASAPPKPKYDFSPYRKLLSLSQVSEDLLRDIADGELAHEWASTWPTS